MLEHKYGAFDIKIRNINNEDINTEMHLPFILKEARNVFEGDNNSKYITENNIDFLEETGTRKTYAYNDSFLRPPMISKCEYDFLSGSNGSYTPLRYKLNHRNYFYVTSGSIDIKLIPPHLSWQTIGALQSAGSPTSGAPVISISCPPFFCFLHF